MMCFNVQVSMLVPSRGNYTPAAQLVCLNMKHKIKWIHFTNLFISGARLQWLTEDAFTSSTAKTTTTNSKNLEGLFTTEERYIYAHFHKVVRTNPNVGKVGRFEISHKVWQPLQASSLRKLLVFLHWFAITAGVLKQLLVPVLDYCSHTPHRSSSSAKTKNTLVLPRATRCPPTTD